MEMNVALEVLLDAIRADYAAWTKPTGDADRDQIREKMIDNFNEKIRIQPGRKYIKIITGGSVWGFIVAGDNDKKFCRGDILKAASWATPARNKSRGNILDGGYSVAWTGPHYL